jgi:hypothetical protein
VKGKGRGGRDRMEGEGRRGVEGRGGRRIEAKRREGKIIGPPPFKLVTPLSVHAIQLLRARSIWIPDAIVTLGHNSREEQNLKKGK